MSAHNNISAHIAATPSTIIQRFPRPDNPGEKKKILLTGNPKTCEVTVCHAFDIDPSLQPGLQIPAVDDNDLPTDISFDQLFAIAKESPQDIPKLLHLFVVAKSRSYQQHEQAHLFKRGKAKPHLMKVYHVHVICDRFLSFIFSLNSLTTNNL